MKYFLFFLFATAFSAHALETDNYLSWNHDLPDSAEDINQLIQTQIEEVLATQSGKKNVSCENITFNIASRFKTRPIKGEMFVNWSTEHLGSKIFPATDKYLEESIYRETPKLLMKIAPLAPNIQTGGIYFGLDKLSHFASTGRRYLKEYLKQLKKGSSDEDSENAAIDLGLSNEAGILGIWVSGVFSFGDLEANYQGLRFYRKFCLDQKDSYLEQVSGQWKLAKVPDIRDYVTPDWDETFNLSYRAPKTWKGTSALLKQEYCELRQSENVVSRFKLYEEKATKSRSRIYIENLRASGFKKIPDPLENQSFDKLCTK